MTVRILSRPFPGSFSTLAEDHVSLIVQNSKLPAMRSLAQVSKTFNEHLKEKHRLDKINRKMALKELKRHDYPVLRTLNMATVLAESGSGDLLSRFLGHLPMGDSLPPESTFLSALSHRTGLGFKNSVQAELQKSSWKKSSPLESVDQLSQWCMPSDDRERLPAKEVFGMIKHLPDRVKACAFTRLVYDLQEMKLLGATHKERSQKKINYLANFEKVATELLPTTWSPWLAEPNHLPASPVRHQRFAFIGAALVFYQHLKGSQKHRFAEALLRLVMSAARDLPEGSQDWKSLRKNFFKNDLDWQTSALEIVLKAVFQFADADSLGRLKKFLLQSGFLPQSKANLYWHIGPEGLDSWTCRI